MKKRLISAVCLLVATGIIWLAADSQDAAEAVSPHGYTVTENAPAAETTKDNTVPDTENHGDNVALQIGSNSVEQQIDGTDRTEDNVQQEQSVEADQPETMPEGNVDAENNEADDNGESEYANLAIANVTKYVNVRSLPSTDGEIVGKIYNGAVAQVLEKAGENEEWFHVTSGNVTGYIKAEFFLYGDEAAASIDKYVTRYAVVKADRLNVRKEPDVESKRIGYIDNGERAKMVENRGEWILVQYTDKEQGFVSAEYVTIEEEFTYAKTLEEERKELEALKALEARKKEQEKDKPEKLPTMTVTPPSTTYTSNEELRKSIVEYAKQYVGYPYVHGGKSLETGTDCSGFTSLIYKEYGYSLSRTPAGQLSGAGRGIDYSEIQPGDIICYSSNGGASCTHVALYIGDGQIVHAANSKKGVIIGKADYSPIVGVRNVID